MSKHDNKTNEQVATFDIGQHRSNTTEDGWVVA